MPSVHRDRGLSPVFNTSESPDAPAVASLTAEDASHFRQVEWNADFDPAFVTEVSPHLTNVDIVRFSQMPITKPIPAEAYRHPRVFYITQSNWDVPDAAIPDIPVDNEFTFFYLYLRTSSATSWGVAAPQLDDVPTSWRNARNCFRITLERNEFTSAHQVSLVASIEREILAGLGADYVAASTTARLIDFRQTAAGANDPLIQADLEALGWTVASASRMTKLLNGFTWNIDHN